LFLVQIYCFIFTGAHGPGILTSASAEGEAAEEPELVGEAIEFLDIAAATAGAVKISLIFWIIRLGCPERDFAIIASVLFRLHYISPS
jgi:hypothetical protein